jgi:hypothetical protein
MTSNRVVRGAAAVLVTAAVLSGCGVTPEDRPEIIPTDDLPQELRSPSSEALGVAPNG